MLGCVKTARPVKSANISEMHTLDQYKGFKMIGFRGGRNGLWHPLVFTQSLGGGKCRRGFIYFGKGEQHRCFKYPINEHYCESIRRILWHMFEYGEKELESCCTVGGFKKNMPRYKVLKHYRHATLTGSQFKNSKRWTTSNIMFRAGRKVKPCAGCEQKWRDQ